MYVIHKLRPDRSITGLIPAITALAGGAILWIFVSVSAAFTFLAIFFWVYALYTFVTFIRTGNSVFLVPALYQLFGGFTIYSWSAVREGPRVPSVMFLVFCTLFFLVWMIYLLFTKRIKWRGREVLELAALPVEDIGNGYTSRPLPSGKIEYTHTQIMEFANFARKHLIAVSYVDQDKVVFVPVMMGREFRFMLGLKDDYTDETWVAFSFDGNVTVNIAHRDYLEYKESLAFDQLCEAMGNLFIDFIEMYQRGEGVRIIDRMDAVGVSVFS